MADVVVPVGVTDTPATLAARYTIGGAAYAPALVQHNAWLDESMEAVGPDTLLSSMGITGAAIPSNWLRPGAQVASQSQYGLNYPLAGVPIWMWGAGIALFLAVRR